MEEEARERRERESRREDLDEENKRREQEWEGVWQQKIAINRGRSRILNCTVNSYSHKQGLILKGDK